MTEDAHVNAMREHIPVLSQSVYMNTGTAGPLSLPVAEAMIGSVRGVTSDGRIGGAYFMANQERMARVRVRLAGLLGCNPNQVALTHNTTEGMNFITLGVNWARGDEAVTTNVEHPGALLPLWVAKERYGVTVKTADVAGRPDDIVGAVMDKVTSRTKLISISHVSYATGDVLPVEEIAAEARKLGVLVLADGAQSFCAMPVDVEALGVDFYSVPGQKWLSGPEGTGALYSRQDSLSQIRTTFAGYGTIDSFNDYGGLLVKEDGRRFEQGTMQPASIAGQEAACSFFAEVVEASWAYEHIFALAEQTIQGLSALPGVRVITKEVSHAGLVTFQLEGIEPDQAVAALDKRRILVRSIRRPAAVRASLGFFNTDQEVQLLLDAVRQIVKADKEG